MLEIFVTVQYVDCIIIDINEPSDRDSVKVPSDRDSVKVPSDRDSVKVLRDANNSLCKTICRHL